MRRASGGRILGVGGSQATSPMRQAAGLINLSWAPRADGRTAQCFVRPWIEVSSCQEVAHAARRLGPQPALSELRLGGSTLLRRLDAARWR